jgi:hypothetical protein
LLVRIRTNKIKKNQEENITDVLIYKGWFGHIKKQLILIRSSLVRVGRWRRAVGGGVEETGIDLALLRQWNERESGAQIWAEERETHGSARGVLLFGSSIGCSSADVKCAYLS